MKKIEQANDEAPSIAPEPVKKTRTRKKKTEPEPSQEPIQAEPVKKTRTRKKAEPVTETEPEKVTDSEGVTDPVQVQLPLEPVPVQPSESSSSEPDYSELKERAKELNVLDWLEFYPTTKEIVSRAEWKAFTDFQFKYFLFAVFTFQAMYWLRKRPLFEAQDRSRLNPCNSRAEWISLQEAVRAESRPAWEEAKKAYYLEPAKGAVPVCFRQYRDGMKIPVQDQESNQEPNQEPNNKQNRKPDRKPEQASNRKPEPNQDQKRTGYGSSSRSDDQNQTTSSKCRIVAGPSPDQPGSGPSLFGRWIDVQPNPTPSKSGPVRVRKPSK